ncbi:Aste57867_8808 [Aphanomyces stellatus]|uniref:ubiquitinyl hydrolase 1 n=1 Tax=Aphanomyces stellatus TaxID=120398 RepID=A0A485KL65_9STRA|nr:hypothetical protein As57867_008773 [Aphanomyces stellatus]VFT85694.1 Aste57867_8808 [Aphanomyces stellatus]
MSAMAWRPDDALLAVYHERQVYMRCGLHAVNNLLQRKAFETDDFAAIAQDLNAGNSFTWWNPHQTLLGIGNYSVDVLTVALAKHGYTLSFFDRRKSMDALDLDVIDGVLVNVMTRSWMGMWQSRHWFALAKVEGTFYNLDSKLPRPTRFESLVPVRDFLQAVLASSQDNTVLVVTPQTNA